MYAVFPTLAATAGYWLTVALTVAAGTLPILVFKYLGEHYAPAVDDFWRRVVHDPARYGMGGAVALHSLVQVEVLSNNSTDLDAARETASPTLAEPSPLPDYSGDGARDAVTVGGADAPPAPNGRSETAVEPFTGLTQTP